MTKPPKDRDIAMVFQNYALYPHMTVYDNMAFGLKLRKYDKDDIDKRVHKASLNFRTGRISSTETSRIIWWTTAAGCFRTGNCA